MTADAINGIRGNRKGQAANEPFVRVFFSNQKKKIEKYSRPSSHFSTRHASPSRRKMRFPSRIVVPNILAVSRYLPAGVFGSVPLAKAGRGGGDPRQREGAAAPI